METSLFILALSKTLPESCLQGLLVFIALKLLFSVYKNSSPALRFNLYYGASVLLFAGFLFTLFQHFSEAQNAALNSFAASNLVPSSQIVPAGKPAFWQILSYWTSRYAYTITGLYVMGLVFCVLRLTIGLININWFRKNEQQQESQWDKQVAALAKHFNLVKTVSVYLSHKIQVPLTIGFLKPVIIFPVALVNQLSIAQTEAILLHELAHITRADYLLNIFLSIIQSFLFFNPIIWLMGREINLYREQCCDDLVLDKTRDTLAYAHALLQIETCRNTQLTLALAANGKKYTLLNRIKRITQMKTNNPSPQNKLIVLLLTITTIGISVAWNVPAKKAIKKFAAHHLTHFKMVETKPDSSITEMHARKITIARKTARDSNKTVLITDTIYIDHQGKNRPGNKLAFVGKEIVYDQSADTVIKSKNKFKIVLEDSTGNKKEYNSIEELPADARKEFLKENGKSNTLGLFNNNFNDTSNYASVRKYYNSPEWKKKEDAINKMGRDVDNYYSSPEWKKKMADIKIYGEKLGKQFTSPEWKRQQEDIRKQGEEIRKQMNNPEFKKQMEDIRVQGEEIQKQFNSPEWKKQMEDIGKQGEEIRKQFNSPEWKKQMEDLRLQSKQISKQGEEMRKYYQSPEWKKQQKKIQKEIEKSQKEWKKSIDFYVKPALPKKPATIE